MSATIRQHRLDRAWTQHQLAQAAGLHVDDVFSHEHGNRIPSGSELNRYAAAFGVDRSDIEPTEWRPWGAQAAP